MPRDLVVLSGQTSIQTGRQQLDLLHMQVQIKTRALWLHVESTIDRNDGACHVGRSVIQKAGHDVRDLLRFAKSTDRNSRDDIFEYRLGNRRHHVSIDESRSHTVDGNALSCEFESERLGESVHS